MLVVRSTHESFDALVGVVWLHSEAVGRAYSVFSRGTTQIKLRCVTGASCSFRVNARQGDEGCRVTFSCTTHSCDTKKAKRKRNPKKRVQSAANEVRQGFRDADSVVGNLLDAWKRELVSGGSNNSIRLAGIRKVAALHHAEKPLLAGESVLLDLGSGAGIACCYYALQYGCRTIGVEYCPELVEISRRFAHKAGVADLCTFYTMDFTTIPPEWFSQEGISHVFIFDGVFSPQHWNTLFHDILCGLPTGTVGVSVSKFSGNWPEDFQTRGDSIPGVGLAGSTSSFSFRLWEKVNQEEKSSF